MAHSEPPQSSHEAERIGAYRIVGRLGSGGMGEVLLAYDERLERHVAIKRIRHESVEDERFRQRLRREAKSAAKLSHPAVVQVYDLLEDESGDHIVMEYVQGPTIAQRLGKGSLDLSDAVEWARQIALGLAEAHSRGLIHRDLKAENVVVTLSGSVKILDFGLAKPLHKPTGEQSLTRAGTLVGTSRSMSPEQAGGGEADHRSDLFSLGVLLYEMVTGISPFRGKNILETLKKVVGEAPVPPAALRPEIPQALSDLIERLLEKDPQRRIPNALEASRQLQLIQPRISAAKAHSGSAAEQASGQPLSGEPTGTSPSPWPVQQLQETPQAEAAHRRYRKLLPAAALFLVAIVSALAYFVATRQPAPLRVAVLQPAVSGPREAASRIDVVKSGLVLALVDSLISMQGITPLDPGQLRGIEGSANEMARAVAADEVIRSDVECLAELCRITLSRIRGADGGVIWADSLDVSSNPLHSATAADAVRTRLRRTYADYPLQPAASDLRVSDADYASFLEITLRVERGEASLEPLLAELEKIMGSSPRFLGAYLWAAELCRSIYTRTRERSILEKGLRFAETALDLAPADSRPVTRRFQLLVEAGRLNEAGALLEQREQITPENFYLLLLRSRLAGREGKLEEAVEWMQRAVELNPAWQNLYRLADLEYRLGRIAPARAYLNELLRRVPGNRWGLSKLGQVELVYGDLSRAEEIFLELIDKDPSRASYTNLGLIRALSGRYAEAVEAYQAALQIAPEHLTVLMNLADARMALGQPQAKDVYARLLQRLQESEAEAGLSPKEAMYKAQCLVQLDRYREAVKTVQQALQEAPGDAEVLYSAAWVYACIGERHSALVHAERALQKGYQARWFRLPGFQSLQGDAEFQALLKKDFKISPRP